MAKLIGYILMILGLALIALPLAFKSAADKLPLVNQNPLFTIIIGVLLIVAGFFFLKKGKPHHASEEVPIYEGAGKKRKIVGYRR